MEEDPRRTVVEERALLEDVPPDRQQKALGGQRRADGPRCADRDGESRDIHLDRIDILRAGGVRCRSDGDDVNGWQFEGLGGGIVAAGHGSACINEGDAGDRRGRGQTLLLKL